MPNKRQTPTLLERRVLATRDDVDVMFLCDGPACEIEAVADGAQPKRFDGIAYSGGSMRPSGVKGDVVVDLSGVSVVEGNRPILHNHDTTRVVGHSDNIQINETSGITVQGIVSGTGPAATEVLDSSRNGFPWKMSIGARILATERIAAGRSIKVNGRQFNGPLTIVRKSSIHEISVVAVPGDFNTSISIAATHTQGSSDMKFNEWLTAKGFDPDNLEEKQMAFLKASYDAEEALKASPPEPEAKPTIKASLATAAVKDDDDADDKTAELRAARAAEIRRCGAIDKLCKNFPDLHAQAIEEGWDSDKTELEVFKADMDKGPAIHIHNGGSQPENVLEAALCVSGGLTDVENQYDDKTLQAAHTAYGGELGMQQILLAAARDGGYMGHRSNFANHSTQKDILQAAFSTVTLPGILSNTANKFLLQGFNQIEDTWRQIASVSSVNDFKTVTHYRLLGDLTYKALAPTGEIQHAQVSEESFTNAALTYGRMMAITRTDIINDDLNALTGIPIKLGHGAAHALNTIFWTEFLDNGTFFTAARNNYFDGADSALDIDSLTAAELLFLDQVDPDNFPLGLSPSILLVPNALNVTATKLMHDTEVRDESSGAGTAKYTTGNPHAGKFSVKRSSFLGNASLAGYSVAAWYLLANPQQLSTIEVVFLAGKQVPTLDTAEADFDTLGIQMRGYHDFGVNKQEYLAGVKSKGTA